MGKCETRSWSGRSGEERQKEAVPYLVRRCVSETLDFSGTFFSTSLCTLFILKDLVLPIVFWYCRLVHSGGE